MPQVHGIWWLGKGPLFLPQNFTGCSCCLASTTPLAWEMPGQQAKACMGQKKKEGLDWEVAQPLQAYLQPQQPLLQQSMLEAVYISNAEANPSASSSPLLQLHPQLEQLQRKRAQTFSATRAINRATVVVKGHTSTNTWRL
jgi:hypothetical protein